MSSQSNTLEGKRLLAISDLHIGHRHNRDMLNALRFAPTDWLIVAGDVGETPEQLDEALAILGAQVEQLIWVPGNHELWTLPRDVCQLRGEARYRRLVEVCRARRCLTPEDPFATFPGPDGPYVIAPLFVLYDYTFAPDEVGPAGAIAWAKEAGLLCADEIYLHCDPYPSRAAWCADRVQQSVARLRAVPGHVRLILVNHFPLHRALAVLPRIPRFTIWCGTRATEDWHTRFGVEVVVSGHLHIPSTRWLDGVRFEEVSLGYARERRADRPAQAFLREILPGRHVEPGRDIFWR